MNYKSFNLGDWIGHISGVIEDETTLDGNEMRDLVEFLSTLEQEPIDYKTQYENYLKKSEVVISQLRADRDRLQDAFDKLRAEIERQEKWLMDAGYNAYNVDIAFNAVKLAVDKYRAETEEENVSL